MKNIKINLFQSFYIWFKIVDPLLSEIVSGEDEKNKLSDLRLMYSFIVTTTGAIQDITYYGANARTDISEIKDDLLKDVRDELSKRKYKPGLFRGEKVPFSLLLSLEIH